MKCDRTEQDDRSTHVWPPWKLANPVYKSQIKVVTKAGLRRYKNRNWTVLAPEKKY